MVLMHPEITYAMLNDEAQKKILKRVTASTWPTTRPNNPTGVTILLSSNTIGATAYVQHSPTDLWFMPTYVVHTCICDKSFPIPKDF